MQFAILYAVAMASAVNCAYVPTEPYSTLTPSATLKSGTTDYPSTFGIVVEQVATTSSSIAKRDVASQVGDGQVQATTATAKTTKAAATQIGDGQVQATTAAAKTTKAAATQIGDGQVQATTATAKATTAKVASQIGDGQVQATTAKVASQIGDGQVQATTAKVASQIGDGQVQATTAKGASQIGDGQVQASTASGASQVSDGQIQATGTSGQSGVDLVSCSSSDSLSMTLKGGILTDSKGRVGSIVANRQFQFDGPPPQAGAIYAAGWEVSPEGYLAIGNTTTFYQCLSGTFYNLYDQSIGSQCHPVHLAVANLVSC